MAVIFRLMSLCLLLAASCVAAAACWGDLCGHGFLENAYTEWNGTTAKTSFAYTAFMDNRTKTYEDTKAGSDWTSGEFVYDGYGQLDEETRDNSTTNYAFDSSYNLTTFGSNSLSYSSNQLTAVNTTERQFSYNAQGARTLDDRSGTTNDYEFEYDPFGNLTQVKKGGAVIYTADYDAFGRRFRWSDGTNTSYFLYDGSVPFAEFNASGTLQRRIFWGPTGPICLRQSSNRWFIADKFGNTRVLVDDYGAITDYYAYDAWGNPVSAKSSGSSYNPFRWNGSSGYQFVNQTALYHVGTRDYDPTVGRWLQRDPIEMNGGWPNLYGYVANDPVEAADPTGTREASLAPWWAGLITDDGPGADMNELAENVRLQNRDWVENMGDFFAGMGDTLTHQPVMGFSWTKLFRNGIGAGWSVDEDSGYYHGGEATGVALETAIGAGAGASVAGLTTKLMRYEKVGGYGLNICRNEERILTLDWHRWGSAPWWKWFHYHRRPGIGKHRPWQSGW